MVNAGLYSTSTMGKALTDTLDDMVARGLVAPELAFRVADQFDKSMAHALNQITNFTHIKGNLLWYRHCDFVWTFIVTDATFRNVHMVEKVPWVKIVACASTLYNKPQEG